MVKSCGTCKHCLKHKETMVAGNPVPAFWSCDTLYDGDMPVKVSPPYDDPCEKWEVAKCEK